MRLTWDHYVLGLDCFNWLTVEVKNLARQSFLILFTLLRWNLNKSDLPEEKAGWRKDINRLKSSVIHGASLERNVVRSDIIKSTPVEMILENNSFFSSQDSAFSSVFQFILHK